MARSESKDSTHAGPQQSGKTTKHRLIDTEQEVHDALDDFLETFVDPDPEHVQADRQNKIVGHVRRKFVVPRTKKID